MFKKFNKKGFTLIELLAVIVILAIVAAVTMTVIVPMLGSKPGEAAVISVKEIEKAINNACTAQGLDGNPYGTLPSSALATEETLVDCQSGTCHLSGTDGQALLNSLKVSGEAPSKYSVTITNCRIESSCYSWTGGQFNNIKISNTAGTLTPGSGPCA